MLHSDYSIYYGPPLYTLILYNVHTHIVSKGLTFKKGGPINKFMSWTLICSPLVKESHFLD